MPILLKRLLAVLAVFLLGTSSAFAHGVHEAGLAPFVAGVLHPLTGADHLLALAAFGLWLGGTSDRGFGVSLSVLLISLVAGFCLSYVRFGLPYIEPVILASVFVGGLLLAFSVSAGRWTSGLIVGFFAFFHGYAHGTEAPGVGELFFFLGFIFCSLTIVTAGYVAASRARRITFSSTLGRVVGGAVLLGGALFSLAR